MDNLTNNDQILLTNYDSQKENTITPSKFKRRIPLKELKPKILRKNRFLSPLNLTQIVTNTYMCSDEEKET